MAGHSKWANIQHRKKAQDSKRAKIFTRLIREITVASRSGGSDPGSNPRLRLAIDKGLSANMPKDNIERAIKRGVGELDGVAYEQISYEGYGPGGTAILVACMTDNRNRTVGEVRHAFSKYGGNLGTDGSVAYLFNEQGVLSFAADSDEDALFEAALEAGADDVISNDDGSKEVITSAENFLEVKQAMTDAGFVAEQAEVTFRANLEVELEEEDGRKLLQILDVLEDLDDVQNVYSNGNIPEAAFE